MKKRSTKCLVNISIKNIFFNIWSTFNQHNNVDPSISVSQMMYSKSLGLDCQRFYFRCVTAISNPHTQGKSEKSQSPHTQAPTHREKNVKSASPHTHRAPTHRGKNRKIAKSSHTASFSPKMAHLWWHLYEQKMTNFSVLYRKHVGSNSTSFIVPTRSELFRSSFLFKVAF